MEGVRLRMQWDSAWHCSLRLAGWLHPLRSFWCCNQTEMILCAPYWRLPLLIVRQPGRLPSRPQSPHPVNGPAGRPGDKSLPPRPRKGFVMEHCFFSLQRGGEGRGGHETAHLSPGGALQFPSLLSSRTLSITHSWMSASGTRGVEMEKAHK